MQSQLAVSEKTLGEADIASEAVRVELQEDRRNLSDAMREQMREIERLEANIASLGSGLLSIRRRPERLPACSRSVCRGKSRC